MPYLTCILSHEWLLQHIFFSLVSFFMLVFPLMGVMQYELYAHCHLEVVMCSRTTLLYICAKQNKEKTELHRDLRLAAQQSCCVGMFCLHVCRSPLWIQS